MLVSTVFGLAALVAIFGFGAPPVIFLPLALCAATLNIGLELRAEHRSDRL